MIDITDPRTLSVMERALRRALNSLDQEIASLTSGQRSTKLALLRKDRDDMVGLYADLMADHGPDDLSTDPVRWSWWKLVQEIPHGMPAVVQEFERRNKSTMPAK